MPAQAGIQVLASAAAAQRRRLRPTGSSRTSTVPPVAPALSCPALALAAVNPHANVPSVRRHHHCTATYAGGGPLGGAPRCLAGQVVWGSGAGAIRGTLTRRVRRECKVAQTCQGHGPCSASLTRRTNPGPPAPPQTELGRENHRRQCAANRERIHREKKAGQHCCWPARPPGKPGGFSEHPAPRNLETEDQLAANGWAAEPFLATTSAALGKPATARLIDSLVAA